MFIVNFNFNANIPTSQAIFRASVEVCNDTDVPLTNPSIYAFTVHGGDEREENLRGEQSNGKFCNF